MRQKIGTEFVSEIVDLKGKKVLTSFDIRDKIIADEIYTSHSGLQIENILDS